MAVALGGDTSLSIGDVSFALALIALLQVFYLAYVSRAAAFGTECDLTQILGRHPSGIVEEGGTEGNLRDMHIAEAVALLAFICHHLALIEL